MYCSYPLTRGPDDYKGDIWDGTLLGSVSDSEKKDTIQLGICSDFAVFRTSTNESVGPVNALVYNFPPPIRSSFAGLLFMGMIPPKPKNYKIFYNAILSRLDRQGCFDAGFTIDDSTGEKKKIAVAVKVHKCCCLLVIFSSEFPLLCQHLRQNNGNSVEL